MKFKVGDRVRRKEMWQGGMWQRFCEGKYHIAVNAPLTIEYVDNYTVSFVGQEEFWDTIYFDPDLPRKTLNPDDWL